jgi:hypothetical protein
LTSACCRVVAAPLGLVSQALEIFNGRVTGHDDGGILRQSWPRDGASFVSFGRYHDQN